MFLALTGVAQRAGHCPTNQKVAGSIPRLGTSLGCRPGPWLGGVQVATDQCFSYTRMSLSLSLSFPLSKNK